MTLNNLANDKHQFVRRSLAWFENTHSSLLAKLSKDIDTEVRCGVASNPNTELKTFVIKKSIFFKHRRCFKSLFGFSNV